MKYRTCVLALSSLFLGLLLISFSWLKERCAAPTPIPSHTGGYYEDSFLLELAAPSNGKIYYTTDGSTPGTESAVYHDGILLEDRSFEQNKYSSIQNVVADWKEYEPDLTPVPKGTVVRALFVNDWGMESPILTQTYFVGISKPERGYTLSLIFEDDALFGDNGIYITGKEYDDWYLSKNPSSIPPTPNFEKDMEVPAILELIDDSSDILNQSIGVRIQGGTARGESKKRLTLVAREEYSGSQVFDANLFGNKTHSVMLKSYLPDAIVNRLLSDRSLALQKSLPVRVFFNGEYWYDTYMLERFDANYFQQHYQVDDHLIVKHGIPDESAVASAEGPPYQEFMHWVENADFSDENQWDQFQKETDVQSYIDYIVTNYYLCNIDFGDTHNYVLWRSLRSGKSKYEDLRWRWCIYDIDTLEWVNNNPIHPKSYQINTFNYDYTFNIRKTTIFPALCENSEFRKQFVLSFMDIVNNNFSPKNVEPILTEYGYNLEWKDSFFLNRPAYAIQHLADEFSLTGSLENITISTEQPKAGTVIVNTSEIDLSDGGWSGKYFTDYPITVTAVPNEGYTFLGWKGDASGSSETLTVSVDGGVTLKAMFAKVK